MSAVPATKNQPLRPFVVVAIDNHVQHQSRPFTNPLPFPVDPGVLHRSKQARLIWRNTAFMAG
jgi:hypothetical protein